MKKGDICTKEEVTNFMAMQGLVYSGLDEYFDEWFDRYIDGYGFEQIGDNEYYYHEDDEW